ncbi:hypothetical protein [Flavobacterium sp.]|uniref:hypothetical protein n=1 Tax=Flavobacterium sp. TaxID=239 RepID=UPI003266CE4A
MKVEIVEGKNHSLYAYKDNELLFYSTMDFNFWKKTKIKIFNKNDILILELQRKEFFINLIKNDFKILFQNSGFIKNIMEINSDLIHYEENKKIVKNNIYFLSFGSQYSYNLNGIKIGKVNQKKFWASRRFFLVEINDNDLEYLEYIIIHFLANNTNDE